MFGMILGTGGRTRFSRRSSVRVGAPFTSGQYAPSICIVSSVVRTCVCICASKTNGTWLICDSIANCVFWSIWTSCGVVSKEPTTCLVRLSLRFGC